MDSTIHNKLLPGEEILWEGQSQNTNSMNLSKGCSSIFGIFWLGLTLFWTIGAFIATRQATGTDAFSSIMQIIFPLFGLPFVSIGVFLVFGAPIKRKKKNQSTYYYVTDKRIIINIDTQKSPFFTSVFMHDLKGIHTIKNRDNTGNIIFENHFIGRTYSSQGYSTPNIMPGVSNCFYRIADADDVYKLILLQQQLRDLKES